MAHLLYYVRNVKMKVVGGDCKMLWKTNTIKGR